MEGNLAGSVLGVLIFLLVIFESRGKKLVLQESFFHILICKIASFEREYPFDVVGAMYFSLFFKRFCILAFLNNCVVR